jgi:hypothetical protein
MFSNTDWRHSPVRGGRSGIVTGVTVVGVRGGGLPGSGRGSDTSGPDLAGRPDGQLDILSASWLADLPPPPATGSPTWRRASPRCSRTPPMPALANPLMAIGSSVAAADSRTPTRPAPLPLTLAARRYAGPPASTPGPRPHSRRPPMSSPTATSVWIARSGSEPSRNGERGSAGEALAARVAANASGAPRLGEKPQVDQRARRASIPRSPP